MESVPIKRSLMIQLTYIYNWVVITIKFVELEHFVSSALYGCL